MEFPLGTKVDMGGVMHHLLGYTEEDRLILSPVDPMVDYDGAVATRKYLCAAHLRDGTFVKEERLDA